MSKEELKKYQEFEDRIWSIRNKALDDERVVQAEKEDYLKTLIKARGLKAGDKFTVISNERYEDKFRGKILQMQDDLHFVELNKTGTVNKKVHPRVLNIWLIQDDIRII